jgi:DNA-binding MarR family transcriptional regulator
VPEGQRPRGEDSHGATAEAFDADLARSAVALILEGQEPPFEGRVRARMDEARWFDSPDELFEAGMDYFGPVARKRRRPLAGFSKEDVADTTNVVWLDLDPPPGAAADDSTHLVAEAGRWLDGLRSLDLPPSVFVFSGRGSWAYWKLDRHVPQREAEALMRRLYVQFRPGGSEHDIGRVARMPGSANEKTGLRAFVMAIDEVRWDPGELRRLLPEADPSDGASKAVEYDRTLKPGGKLPAPELPSDLAVYLAARPPKKRRVADGIDGSSREQAIVSRLVNAGHSDEQIALFFDHHRLPRHEEEKRRRRNYGWLAVGIANARARIIPSSPSVSIGKGTYSEEAGGEGYGPRETGWSMRRWVILRDMPEGLPKLELAEWVKQRFSLGRSQALRELDWLEKEKGYICALADERDRRIRRVFRTEAGRRRLESWKGMGTPFEFLKGLPSPAVEAPGAPEPAQDPEPEPEPTPPPRETKPARTPIDAEIAADRAERRRRERSLINDVYRIHIPGTRWTYLQLLLPLEEWARVRLHEQLRVGVDGEGLPVHRSFISPRDPALRGRDARDPIEERTLRDGGFVAPDRRIGVAAELADTGKGFELATRVEGDKTLPNVGLIVQADKIFYRPLRAYRNHQDKVIAARKRGKGIDTTFEFMIAGDGIEIPTEPVFDLDAFLHRLADESEMAAVLESLPDGWRLVKRPPW